MKLISWNVNGIRACVGDGIDVNYGEKVHIVFPSIDAKEKYYIKLTKGDTGTYAKGTIFLS